MKYAVVIFLLFFLAGCINQNYMVERADLPSIKDVPARKWEKLANKQMYFGHKSVGYGIVDGMKEVIKENDHITLNIVESRGDGDSDVPVFAHSSIGSNNDPGSKMSAFEEIVRNGVGDNYDAAFFKFCWADMPLHADIDIIFNDYKALISRIRAEYPDMIFIHVTVPLTVEFEGGKALVKKAKDVVKEVIGKKNYYNNATRNKFNEMLRREYAGKAPLFDLARLESTRDGEQRSFVKGEITHYMLLPENTDDGGHLNKKGRKMVAEQFLIYLAQVLD